MESQPSSQRAPFHRYGCSCLPSCQLRHCRDSRILHLPQSLVLAWVTSTWQVTLGSTPNTKQVTTRSRLKGRAHGRSPTGSKGPGQGFKCQHRTWQSILCPWDKAAAQFPPKDSSVVGFARCWQLLRVPGQPFTLESSSKKGAGEGFAPSPECPSELGTSWMQSLCGWEAERQWRHTSCTPSSCQRLWTPNGRQGKLKSHHCFPPCPHPLSGKKQLVLLLLPTQTGQEQPLGDGQEPILPCPQLPHLGTAAGLCQCPQQPWGRASPPKAGQCHTATRNDESPGITHCCSSRHCSSLLAGMRGGDTVSTRGCRQDTRSARAAGSRSSTCPCHHSPLHAGGLECGEFQGHWAHRHLLHRQGNLSGLGMLCSPPARAKLKAAIPKLKRAPDADLSLFRGTSVRCLPHLGFEVSHPTQRQCWGAHVPNSWERIQLKQAVLMEGSASEHLSLQPQPGSGNSPAPRNFPARPSGPALLPGV